MLVELGEYPGTVIEADDVQQIKATYADGAGCITTFDLILVRGGIERIVTIDDVSQHVLIDDINKAKSLNYIEHHKKNYYMKT